MKMTAGTTNEVELVDHDTRREKTVGSNGNGNESCPVCGRHAGASANGCRDRTSFSRQAGELQAGALPRMFTGLAEPSTQAGPDAPALHRCVSPTNFGLGRELADSLEGAQGGAEAVEAVWCPSRHGLQLGIVPGVSEERALGTLWNRDVRRGCGNR